MRDKFDYQTYWWIIDSLCAHNRACTFAELADEIPNGRFFILRHDVDYCVEAAIRLATQEAEHGIRASYFLLLNSDYYNLLSPDCATVPRRLVELGHDVGLHYDINFLTAHPRDRWPALLAMQVDLLSQLSNSRVNSISMHQPGLNGEDPFQHGVAGYNFVNAYDDRFRLRMPYVSDSCRAWWDAAWEMFESGDIPARLQVALHPINWAENDQAREVVFQSLHARLSMAMLARGDKLLGQIAQHGGVQQHVAREARRPK